MARDTIAIIRVIQDLTDAKWIEIGPLVAPVSEGVEIGRLKVWRGTALALDLPVKTLAAVPEGGLTRRAFDAGLELAQSWLRNTLAKK